MAKNPFSIDIAGATKVEASNARRTFLCQLAALPLIGGGVTLIGQPTAVAEPATFDLLETYKGWLRNEQYYLAFEMAAMPAGRERYQPFELRYKTHGEGKLRDVDGWLERVTYTRAILGSYDNKSGVLSWHDGDPQPSTRAALVLSAVGCDWRV